MGGSTGWQGSLQLVFADRRGTTQLTHNQGTAPLKVQRPFYPEGAEICHSVMLHTAGGIVGGDRLVIDVSLEANSHALITTAAASKVYRSNGLSSFQTIHIQVAEQACLEWLPQETIVFDGACYDQHCRVDLADGASWFGWEIIRLGRSARGEQFLQGNWRSHTEVWQQGQPIWIDPQWLPAGEPILSSPHGLAGCPVVGSFVLIGQTVETDLVEQLRSLWHVHNRQGTIGVTRLMSGVLCRYRGQSTTDVRRWFTEVWNLLRLSYFNRPACYPRVWQL